MARHRLILLALLLISAWLTVPASSTGAIPQAHDCHDRPPVPIHPVWSDPAPAPPPAWRQRRPGHITPGDSDGPPSVFLDREQPALVLARGERPLAASGHRGHPFVDGTRMTRAPPV